MCVFHWNIFAWLSMNTENKYEYRRWLQRLCSRFELLLPLTDANRKNISKESCLQMEPALYFSRKKTKTKTLDVSFCLDSWTCHRRGHLKREDFLPASVASGSYEQITSLRSSWTSGPGSLQSCPLLENTHITPLQQCWDCSEGSIEKLFLCTVWHVTSASHLTHCRIISPSLSWDELCPEDKLQRWISIIVSLLHSCCEGGGPRSEGRQK